MFNWLFEGRLGVYIPSSRRGPRSTGDLVADSGSDSWLIACRRRYPPPRRILAADVRADRGEDRSRGNPPLRLQEMAETASPPGSAILSERYVIGPVSFLHRANDKNAIILKRLLGPAGRVPR